MSSRLRPVLVTLAATVLLASCSSTSGETDASAGTGAGSSEASTAGAEVAEDLQNAAAPDVEPQPVETELPVIATRETTAGQTPLAIDLNSVSASGEVMTVLFTVRNLSDDGRWQISDYFDDGLYSAPLDDAGARSDETSTHNGSTTDGVAVVDNANGTMYRAAYDSAGNCACNVELGSKFVAAGEGMTLTTLFAAPPEDVETVTVQIPGAGSFTDVPLTR